LFADKGDIGLIAAESRFFLLRKSFHGQNMANPRMLQFFPFFEEFSGKTIYEST
jgi:hypothetical protein